MTPYLHMIHVYTYYWWDCVRRDIQFQFEDAEDMDERRLRIEGTS